ncbi:hypothetical protein N7510_011344 [Penicillium lagena]|uniref:uncharacterized protein n=1 Tax=Penicillium lagena TaxID=94218 RepID=UPI002540819B|nr:uncharacterized protein N7510_011344 [Penicillium lagena]KAJ5601810.1 hypothetical protein N7510_011344 [Penicillium lagena]
MFCGKQAVDVDEQIAENRLSSVDGSANERVGDANQLLLVRSPGPRALSSASILLPSVVPAISRPGDLS